MSRMSFALATSYISSSQFSILRAKEVQRMNITQRMYFGQSPLDKDRDRRIAFYGRVSTQHEAQVDALGNQMQ